MITATRLWALGAFVVAIGLAAAGWFMGVSPQLDARSTAYDSLASVQSTNAQIQAKVAKLAADDKIKNKLQDQFNELNTSLPASSSTPAFVTELNSAASNSGVTLSGITVAAAQPYAAPKAAPSASSTTSTGSTPTPAPTAQPGMPPFTSPTVTGSTMAVIPVTITANGDYAKVLNFVKSLQNLQRYYLVTGIATTTQNADASGGANGVSATIDGDIFSITGQASPAGATAASPAH